ncbi:protein NLRC3 [Amphiprion ocellaris]|uniref:protein NLRC3 n=1 Tax=Amphiprion ocellaris TaxID=80972 RepID=UPI0024116BE0|nr:protein NLRC3 [Amphiprion ocellaris]XP_023139763.2 protein NLRC3 [Amphiprion ocellaris]XP_035810427.2 protein NLRC3 [Amphiprion ocellaris]
MDDTDEAMVTPSGSSSIGEAVSGRAMTHSPEPNEDDIYYIPERRPSLDLGPDPMDTTNWHYVDQALSPAQSYKSMTSEENSDEMRDEDRSPTRIELERTDSFSSCYSFDSDDCEKKTIKVKSKDDVSDPSDEPEINENLNKIKHPSVTVAFTFKAICKTLEQLSDFQLLQFKSILWKDYPQSFNIPPQTLDMVDLVDRLLECYSLEESLHLTRTILTKIGQKSALELLETLCIRNEVRYELCQSLRKIYGEVSEDLAMEGEKRPFDDVFVCPTITSTSNNGPNTEHEVLTIEKLHSNSKPAKMLTTRDIFPSKSDDVRYGNLVFFTGVAGSGKSMAVRRLILDWVEERSHKHVDFLFPLPFRDIKQFEGKEVSIVDMIQTFYPETAKLRRKDFSNEDCKILFIFDGLDEYNGELDFHNISYIIDEICSVSLQKIVVNLMRGRLLYRSLFLVTSRPQVKGCIPWDTSHKRIEMRGFSDPEKDEYFKKRLKDADQAARVIAYISSYKTLRIMCHLPLFCSLVADECERIFREQGIQAELPKSITYMYTKLMLTLMRQHRKFRAPDRTPEEERNFLMKLGKLAFDMLEKDSFKITKYQWTDLDISDREAVINSGLCTQYLVAPFVLHQEEYVSFLHPTMQEYLTALYAILSYRNLGKNIFEQPTKNKFKAMFKGHKEMEMYKCAVEKSLLCEDGKFDFVLRFLFGLSAQTNQDLLESLYTSPLKCPNFIEEATALIMKKIRENQYPNRTSNLQQCLVELDF